MYLIPALEVSKADLRQLTSVKKSQDASGGTKNLPRKSDCVALRYNSLGRALMSHGWAITGAIRGKRGEVDKSGRDKAHLVDWFSFPVVNAYPRVAAHALIDLKRASHDS